jgi:hypothetical protein
MPENQRLAIDGLALQSESARDKENYFCKNFKIFPAAKEALGGCLFGIVEMNATPAAEGEKIAETILNTFEHNYFQQISTSPAPEKLNFEAIFEFALNRTNQTLLELIQIGRLDFLKENLNYFIGIARGIMNGPTEISFTHQGTINAMLIHRTQKNNFKAINLLNAASEPPEAGNKIKLFSAICSGQVAVDDTLVVSTEVFANFLSAAKIKHILINNSLAEALAYFRNQIKISGSETNLIYSVLVVRKEPDCSPDPKPLSQNSIANLIRTTETTEKLLTPNLSLNITKHLSAFFRGAGKIFRLPVFARQPREKKKTLEANRPAGRDSAAKNLLDYPRLTLQKLLNLLKKTNRANQPPRPVWRQILTTRNLIIFSFLAVICGAGFGVVATIKNHQLGTAYAAELNLARANLDEAESRLIYKDQAVSLEKIRAAEEIISGLPQTTATQKINRESLNKQVEELKAKIFVIEKVTPQFVADLAIDGQTLPVAEILGSTKEILITTDQANLLIYSRQQKSLKLIDTPSKLSGSIKDGEQQYFLGLENKLFTLANGQLKTIGALAPIQAASSYNQKLYYLDNQNSTIFKQTINEAGLGTPSAWSKNKLAGDTGMNVVALAIDGNLYTARADGLIQKYYAGIPAAFANPALEPAVAALTKIFAGVNSKYLYLAEPGSKRLIVLGKAGEYIKQLSFNLTEEILDLDLDFSAKSGVLLTKTKIYQFSFTE